MEAIAGALPIRGGLGPLVRALDDGRRVVLSAPPGAGKTTVVPLALLSQPWCTGSVVMLEPRRLATRAAATRLADLLGERPGRTVGWRMRNDTKISAATRIEVMTEGTLTRRLQRDPGLDGVSAVVFDEFHERSIHADLGLALTLDIGDLRDDLRIAVMSATLDADPIVRLLDAPLVSVDGRQYPVETVHVDVDHRRERLEAVVARTVAQALQRHEGDVLVFLPGAAEITRAVRSIEGAVTDDVDVRPLFGALRPDVQDAAIRPAPSGRRKVVVATSIAETSLTIDGVTVVVDGGLRRAPRYDHGAGMTRLVTLPVTRAEADQRRGRAGRLGPGHCYRLWPSAADGQRQAHPEPEITVSDLAPLALDLAAWGAGPDELRWLDPPPTPALSSAHELLRLLEAIDADHRITDHGRALHELPLHPRLGHLVHRGASLGHGPLAVDLAALLAEGDVFRGRDRPIDLDSRLAMIRRPDQRADRGAVERIRTDAERVRRQTGIDGSARTTDAAGLLIGLAYPDRIARRRPEGRGAFSLSGGGRASCPATDPLADAEGLAIASLHGDRADARIRMATPISLDEIRVVAGAECRWVDEVRWDDASDDVVAQSAERFGALTLQTRSIADPPPEACTAALLDGVRSLGLDRLPWSAATRNLRARLDFLHRVAPDRYPPADGDTLVDTLGEWLAPFLGGARRWRQLQRVDLREALLARLDWTARRAIDELAPERLTVASGHAHRVDYSVDPPVLAVKLQELFGSTETPTVGGDRVSVVLHLLSPAGRPLQVTQDLPSFWANGYPSVRAEMRGRYPKHPWPEDPTSAEATARTTRRR